MTFDYPGPEEIPKLRKLWQGAFGEWDGFWEMFLETAFSPRRCRCVREKEEIAGALTWLDCTFEGKKIAYIYAVVTDPAHRGKGVCRSLLRDTHALLKQRGYAAAMLVPAEEGLRRMYEKQGYETCTFAEEFSCEPGGQAPALRTVGPEEFALLRRKFLPEGSVLQEGKNLPFLARQMQFYAGEDFLMAAYTDEGKVVAPEILGNAAAAPGILKALDAKKGSFRCPGKRIPFAMIYPLQENVTVPAYFGFAFD